MVHVQFNEDESQVTAVYGSQQDPADHKNQGVVERDDVRLIEYWQSIPQDLLPRN